MKERDVDIIALQETKRECFTDREFNSFQGNKDFVWGWKSARGSAGGILMGVNSEKLEILEHHVGAFFLSMVLKNKDDSFIWELISVYGPTEENLKSSFLDELSWHVKYANYPLVLGGDFNMYRFSFEKSNDNIDYRGMNRFNDFISNHELSELLRSGPRYTWTNKQDNPILVVLDRVLVSQNWESHFPIATLTSLLRIGSDHTPLILDTGGTQRMRERYFRFEPAWVVTPGFKELVCSKMPERDDSYILEFWHKKLVGLRVFLRGWSRNLIREKHKEKEELKKEIEHMDMLADTRELTTEEWELRYQKEADLEHIYEMEELYWHKRSSEQWIVEGDRNTEFFHRVANGRRRKCSIPFLIDSERVLNSQEEMSRHIVEFYKSLFRADPPSNIHLAQEMWSETLHLSEQEQEFLIRPFRIEELDKVIKEAKPNTAPCPDGFDVHFYRVFWPQVRNDLFEMLLMLHNEELDLKRLNYGVITLVPKSSEPTDIRHFRPICVLNDCFKFISKVVTNRMTEVANSVISPTQTAFIPGRFILEGCVIIHEVMHELKRKKGKGILFKIDFEKAYDRVSWPFLFEVMERKRFPPKWINWVKACVRGGRVCVNVNGERSDFFRTYRGLRQGDPLSPLLFNLVSDALAGILDCAKNANKLSGLVPEIFPGGITHLQYADDTVICIPWDEREIITTKFLLYCFEEMAGMKINYHKSEVFTIGLTNEETRKVAFTLNCPVGTFPMKYLGLPISPEKIIMQEFSFLGQKLEKRLGTWMGNLSHAGRAIQINACLSSIPSYAMGFYSLPEGVHHKFDSVRGRYYWAGNKINGKYHMVKWEDMAFPKDFGGLGFTETRAMNIALLAKWIFKLESPDQSLCTSLLRNKYLQEGGVFQCRAEEGSQFWKGVLSTRDWVKLGTEWLVGDGRHILFWKDVWVHPCPLKTSFPLLFEICNQQSILVAEIKQAGIEGLSFRRSFGPR